MTDLDEELSAGRLGRTVGGRWLLERVLGVGGMAAVYAARDPTGAVAAVKMLHPEMSVRREIRERFLREGYVANRIGHPGVVQALEHGEAGDEVFLVMELLAGETLRARVKRHGKLPVGEVLDYADQILDVLVVAHEKGVVHRDLKPDNLFVSPEGRIKILDFGLARVFDGVPSEHRTRTGVALGTIAYMAPEQALGRRAEIDGRVDLFALGATMFRILAGRRVHEAESEAELLMAMASRPAPPLASVVPGISPAVAGVVDLALAFSRDARYPDARTMQGDVRALRQGQPGVYASARLSSREEATRAEPGPTTSQRTQPLSATMQSNLPGTSSTMPMPAGMGAPGAIPRPDAVGFSATQPPASVRTAPLDARPGPYAAAAASAPGAFATTMPSTPSGAPIFSAPAAAAPVGVAKRGSLAIALVFGFAGLAAAGGGAAWYFLAKPGSAGAATPAAGVVPALPAAAPVNSSETPAARTTPVAEKVATTPNAPARKPVKKESATLAAAGSPPVVPDAPPSASAASPLAPQPRSTPPAAAAKPSAEAAGSPVPSGAPAAAAPAAPPSAEAGQPPRPQKTKRSRRGRDD